MVRRTQKQEPGKLKPVLLAVLTLALALAILNPQTARLAGAQEPTATPTPTRRPPVIIVVPTPAK